MEGDLFSQEAKRESWVAAQVTDPLVSGGALKARSLSTTPILRNNGLSFDATVANKVYVRIKASAATQAQLSFARSGESYDPARRIDAVISAPNTWQILTFDVGAHPDWTGTIARLQLHPVTTTNTDFEIDWIMMSNGDRDGDGIPDTEEGFTDTDGDGILNLQDLDSDGDLITDAQERLTGSNASVFSNNDTNFNQNGNMEGWLRSYGVIDEQVLDGTLRLQTRSDGGSSIIKSGYHFAASSVSNILVRMKGSASSSASIYFGVNYEKGLGEDKKRSVNYNVAGQWQVLLFPMSTNTKWTGSITDIRFDQLWLAGPSAEVDWIYFSNGDYDGDGILDAEDGVADADGDGLENFRDTDSDNDGVLDSAAGLNDDNGNGVPNFRDIDFDGDKVNNEQEMLLGRNLNSASDLVYHFNTANNLEGWLPRLDLISLAVSNGVLAVQSPNTIAPSIMQSSYAFLASEVSTFLVRMKGSANGTITLFFTPTTNTGFAEARNVAANYTGNGQWQLVRLQASNHALWTGRIKDLRFDLLRYNNGSSVEVDFIAATNGDLDGDGISDTDEGAGDADNDGLADLLELDSDNDGLPDRLETLYGTSRQVAMNRATDTDSDGQADYYEMLAGTAIDYKDSRFAHSVVINGTQATITLSALPQRIYTIERTTDLVTWTTVTSLTTGVASTLTHVDPLPSSASVFYRIRLSLDPAVAKP
jgi:hypothetical protein